MPARKKASNTAKNSSANLGFEAKLWLAADKLRNNMDAAEYKHVVLGLIFLKYISDTFEEHRAKLLAGEGDYEGADPEDADEPSGARQTATGSPQGERGGANQYKAENVFWVPVEARWPHLQAKAKEPSIGKTVDDAMVALEQDNIRLKGVLPKDYARPGLDKHRLGELIDLIATIELTAASEGEQTHRSVDLLGRVYDWSGATKTDRQGSPQGERGGAHQYFLTRFASAEGKNGGQWSGATWTLPKERPKGERGGVHQFYTPSCVVRCLVEMLAPYKGRIYDPACGSGGMFVQSEKFVESHGGKLGDISIYGQESNATTRRLAVMNLAIRGIEADIGKEHADTFRNVQHPDLRADYVLANPPFNDSDWHRKDDDVRWKYGVPPKGNANFAWVQHFIHHLAPDTAPRACAPTASEAFLQVASVARDNMAGFVLANGSMSSNQSGDCPARSAMKTPKAKLQGLPRQREIRKALIEADLVDCMVALPGQLFYSTTIQVGLWFLTKSKAADQKRSFRDRRQQTLFIDARKMGTLTDRVFREPSGSNLERFSSTYIGLCGKSRRLTAQSRQSARLRRLHDGYRRELAPPLQRSQLRQSSPALAIHVKL